MVSNPFFQFIRLRSNFPTYLYFVCAGGGRGWKSRTTFGSWFSHSSVWVPGTKLWSSVLVVRTIAHCSVFLVPRDLLLICFRALRLHTKLQLRYADKKPRWLENKGKMRGATLAGGNRNRGGPKCKLPCWLVGIRTVGDLNVSCQWLVRTRDATLGEEF